MDYGRRDQYVTVDGGRDSDTSYAADGIFLGSLLFNNMALNPPSDSLQEVSLQRSSFSTEFGQGQAVVSMVTKSGSNRLSAAAFENFRHHALNARNYFAPRNEPEPEFSRNRFGVSLGGPLLRNRAFAFGSYERLSANEEEVHFANVPEPAFLRGNFSSVSTPIRDPLTGQPFPGNVIPQDRILPFAAIQIPAIPAPNIIGPNNYRAIRPFTEDSDSLSFRFDEVLNGDHTLFQRYMWFDSEQAIPSAITDSGRPQVGRNLALGHTWVMSRNFVNEIRFGYAYSSTCSIATSRARTTCRATGSARAVSATSRAERIRAYYGRHGDTLVGWGNAVPQTGVDQGATDKVFSVSSATSKAAGRHNLRFGVQAQYRDLFMNTPVNPQGAFTFNGRATGAANNRANAVADFLLGYCSTCRGQYGSMDSNYVSPTVALFFDDVWQATDKITIQAGVRWEYLAPWHEVDDRAGSVDPVERTDRIPQGPGRHTTGTRAVDHPGGRLLSGRYRQKDLNNWAPEARRGLQPDRPHGHPVGVRHLLPESRGERAAVLEDGAAIRGVVRRLTAGSELVKVDTLFRTSPPCRGSRRLSRSIRTTSRLTRRSRRERAAELPSGLPARSRLHRERWPQAVEALQHEPAVRGDHTAAGASAFPALRSRDLDVVERRLQRLQRNFGPHRQALLRRLFFGGFYQNSKMTDNNSGQAESNDTAFRWDKDADFSLSRYHQRHRSSITFGYELPFGPDEPWLSSGGASQRSSKAGRSREPSGCRAVYRSPFPGARCRTSADSCRTG